MLLYVLKTFGPRLPKTIVLLSLPEQAASFPKGFKQQQKLIHLIVTRKPRGFDGVKATLHKNIAFNSELSLPAGSGSLKRGSQVLIRASFWGKPGVASVFFLNDLAFRRASLGFVVILF